MEAEKQLINRKEHAKPNYTRYWFFGVTFILLLVLAQFYSNPAKKINFEDFNNRYLSKGIVEKIVIDKNSEVAEIHLNQAAGNKKGNESVITFNIGSIEVFEKNMRGAEPNPAQATPIIYQRGDTLLKDLLQTFLLPLLPVLWVLTAYIFLIRHITISRKKRSYIVK